MNDDTRTEIEEFAYQYLVLDEEGEQPLLGHLGTISSELLDRGIVGAGHEILRNVSKAKYDILFNYMQQSSDGEFNNDEKALIVGEVVGGAAAGSVVASQITVTHSSSVLVRVIAGAAGLTAGVGGGFLGGVAAVATYHALEKIGELFSDDGRSAFEQAVDDILFMYPYLSEEAAREIVIEAIRIKQAATPWTQVISPMDAVEETGVLDNYSPFGDGDSSNDNDWRRGDQIGVVHGSGGGAHSTVGPGTGGTGIEEGHSLPSFSGYSSPGTHDVSPLEIVNSPSTHESDSDKTVHTYDSGSSSDPTVHGYEQEDPRSGQMSGAGSTSSPSTSPRTDDQGRTEEAPKFSRRRQTKRLQQVRRWSHFRPERVSWD